MGKLIRFEKFTPKVFATLIFAVVLVAVADPKPGEAYFIAALCVIGVGELIRVWAAGHLRKNAELTTTGPYSFVKNPLYVGTFLITAGVCVLAKGGRTGQGLVDNMNWMFLGGFVLTFLVYYVPYKRKREGERLRGIFGELWDVYDRNVPDYFPRITPFRHPAAAPRRWSVSVACENSEQWTGLAVAALALAITFNSPIIDFFAGLI